MKSFQNHTDESLFSLMKNGDETAFVELYNRYWEKMYHRAHLLLNCREDAEEQVHDIFVRLWQKRQGIQIKYTLHTYLSAMLRYSCFKVLAQRRLSRSHEVRKEQLADHSTEHWLEFEELREELERAVCQLPEKCQQIFRLSREEYLTDKEIAEILDISVHTVRTQMHRALKKLKVALHSFFCF